MAEVCQVQAVAAPPAKPAIAFEQLRGIKQLRHVAELLSKLHMVGCDRDKSGNRDLHFDDYVMLILLYLFNPMIESIALLQGVAELPKVQERLGVKRFSTGSFSESCRVFEPQQLQGVVDQLAKGLLPIERHELLKALPGKLTLVDSSVLRTLCKVAEAIFLPLGDGKHSHAWRLHLQFDVDHHVPHVWDVTTPKNTGKSDEKNVLRRRLEAGHTYVMDRWYAQFTLWNDLKAAGSSYVCRVRDNSKYEVIEDRPLSQEALDAGVVSDQIVIIGLSKKPAERANHPTRLICVKQILGCRHLISTRIEGIQIQIYAAVICCLMLNRLTGKKPTKWMVVLMSLYLQGVATDEDVLRTLNKPDNRGIKLRAEAEIWKKRVG